MNNADQYQLHYWFVECTTGNRSAPVVVWYNGGPGSSALYGYLTEMGPFLTNDASITFDALNKTGGVPELFVNPGGWHGQAHLLWIDSPPPVGFSYCGKKGQVPTAPGPHGGSGKGGCPVWNDTSAGQLNRDALNTFFRDLFPEYARNELHVVGESYAGVYIPELTKAVLADPGVLNLRGIALGNGCMGTESLGGCGTDDMYWLVEFMSHHQAYEKALYTRIMGTCGTVPLMYNNFSAVPGCGALLDEMNAQIGGYYPYDLYDTCQSCNYLLFSIGRFCFLQLWAGFSCPRIALHFHDRLLARRFDGHARVLAVDAFPFLVQARKPRAAPPVGRQPRRAARAQPGRRRLPVRLHESVLHLAQRHARARRAARPARHVLRGRRRRRVVVLRADGKGPAPVVQGGGRGRRA